MQASRLTNTKRFLQAAIDCQALPALKPDIINTHAASSYTRPFCSLRMKCSDGAEYKFSCDFVSCHIMPEHHHELAEVGVHDARLTSRPEHPR